MKGDEADPIWVEYQRSQQPRRPYVDFFNAALPLPSSARSARIGLPRRGCA